MKGPAVGPAVRRGAKLRAIGLFLIFAAILFLLPALYLAHLSQCVADLKGGSGDIDRALYYESRSAELAFYGLLFLCPGIAFFLRASGMGFGALVATMIFVTPATAAVLWIAAVLVIPSMSRDFCGFNMNPQ